MLREISVDGVLQQNTPESRHRAHLKFMRFPATPTAPRTTQTRTAYAVDRALQTRATWYKLNLNLDVIILVGGILKRYHSAKQ